MADFFDKIAGGINKGVSLVSTNSRAMVEKAKINTVIKNLKDERKQLAELLGMKIYEIYMAGKEIAKEDVAKLANEMTKRVRLIAEQEDQMKRLDAEVSMASGKGRVNLASCECGAANPPGAKFCSKCGNSL